jgi:cytochrome b involved in lipid metabolism
MYTYRFTGPADQGILLKNRGNNARLDSKMAMPQKFYPSAGDSMFSGARKIYRIDAMSKHNLNKHDLNKHDYNSDNFPTSGIPIKHTDASQHLYMKKAQAIGKSSQFNISKENPLSFRAQDTTSRNRAISHVRAGGCVAPKKKGAVANSFKSGGGSSLTGTGNRQYVVPNLLYNISEVALHNSVNSAWIVYMGKVYDITTSVWDMSHIDQSYWGTDITSAITSSHSPGPTPNTPTSQSAIEAMLEPYMIGYFV